MKSRFLDWGPKRGSERLIKVLFLFGLVVAVGCAPRVGVAAPHDFSHQRVTHRSAYTTPEISDEFALVPSEERLDLTREYFYLHNPSFFEEMTESSGWITMTPRVIVVHYTAKPTLKETIDYFQPNRIASDRAQVAANGDLNVGIQFVVDTDGRIYRSYPENAVSRHVIGLNHLSIGIENVGDSDLDMGEDGLTWQQLEANVSLIRYLIGKYPTIDFVIAHSEYRDLEDPGHPGHDLFFEQFPAYRTEKVDPGPRFMRELRKRLKTRGSH